jgi:hypothetical protein
MSYITETEISRRASDRLQRIAKSASAYLKEFAPSNARFDVFLSHSDRLPRNFQMVRPDLGGVRLAKVPREWAPRQFV